MSTDGIGKTLNERQSQHGAFVDQTEISQALSEVMHRATNYKSLTPYQRESLEMIQVKIARILEGDRNCPDHWCNCPGHWRDIAGYATLVERALHQEREKLTAKPSPRLGGWIRQFRSPAPRWALEVAMLFDERLAGIKADALKRLERIPAIITDVDKPLPDMPTAADYGLTQAEWTALMECD
jgi:hypothetical protein